MQTKDQERAQDAYDRVDAVVKKGQDKEKFKTLAYKLPAMILQCGVLPTLAYYEKQKSQAFKAVDEWLLNKAGLPWGPAVTGNSRQRLTHKNTDVQLYRLVAREAIAYATWLKRATETLMGEP